MNNEMTLFLGEPIEFWMELRARADNLDSTHLIRCLIEANSKVRYYEMMLDRINEYRKVATK